MSKSHPILFSAPMVRAILAGNKTQTRRVAKGVNLKITHHDDGISWRAEFNPAIKSVTSSTSGGPFTESEARQVIANQFAPYKPGDRLWVRETWVSGPLSEMFAPRELSPSTVVRYPATDDISSDLDKRGPSWLKARKRPSIHMPRWASRITLEVTAVRIERLQSISARDAVAEGVTWAANPFVWVYEFRVVSV